MKLCTSYQFSSFQLPNSGHTKQNRCYTGLLIIKKWWKQNLSNWSRQFLLLLELRGNNLLSCFNHPFSPAYYYDVFSYNCVRLNKLRFFDKALLQGFKKTFRFDLWKQYKIFIFLYFLLLKPFFCKQIFTEFLPWYFFWGVTKLEIEKTRPTVVISYFQLF